METEAARDQELAIRPSIAGRSPELEEPGVAPVHTQACTQSSHVERRGVCESVGCAEDVPAP